MRTRARLWGVSWLLALPALLVAGCGLEHDLSGLSGPPSRSDETGGAVHSVTHRGSDETIRMAAFNIQVFGVTKLGKPHVMDVLAEVMRRFDVIAIQEIRASDQTLMSQFIDLVNSDGSQYDYIIGPATGANVEQGTVRFRL
jgi:deoxyribonuclease-1-like protein